MEQEQILEQKQVTFNQATSDMVDESQKFDSPEGKKKKRDKKASEKYKTRSQTPTTDYAKIDGDVNFLSVLEGDRESHLIVSTKKMCYFYSAKTLSLI